MRAIVFGLVAAVCLSFAPTAHAAPHADGPATAVDHTPSLSTELAFEIPLGNLISPSMQWSHLELDSIKAAGLNSGTPYASSADMMVKSDLIRSFNVAQIERPAPARNPHYRYLNGLLMLAAGLTMWVGLSMQRRY